MKNSKDVGLEDVEIVDFVDDEEPIEDEKKTEKKKCEESLEGITSHPWKNVSHVVIGPNGVTLVPTGTEQKYSLPNSERTSYPKPGLEPTMLEYDLKQLLGTMNAVGDLEKELATTKAELERTKKELEAFKNPPQKEEEPKPKEEDETKMANGEPKSDEERAMTHFKLSKEDWDKLSDDEKKALIAKLPEEKTDKPEPEMESEKSKEEEAKDEKKDASIKDEETQDDKKTEDHEESNLVTAMKLMKKAKENNVL